MIDRFLYWLVEHDKTLFLYLNDKNTPWLDTPMLVFSSYLFWITVCLLLIAFMCFKYKRQGIIASVFLLLSLGVNSLTNNIIKWIIARPRPINNEAFTDIIHAIEKHELSYSFFSAHSSNSFCLALFTLLFFRNKYYSVLAIIWAAVVAYSRIYVGKHYPLDVVVGILFGIFTGTLGYMVYKKFVEKKKLRPHNI